MGNTLTVCVWCIMILMREIIARLTAVTATLIMSCNAVSGTKHNLQLSESCICILRCTLIFKSTCNLKNMLHELHLPLIPIAVWRPVFYQRFGDQTMSREPAMAKVEKMILAQRNRGSNAPKSVFSIMKSISWGLTMDLQNTLSPTTSKYEMRYDEMHHFFVLGSKMYCYVFTKRNAGWGYLSLDG